MSLVFLKTIGIELFYSFSRYRSIVGQKRTFKMCPLTNAEHLAWCRENISPVDRCNAPFHAVFYARTLQFSPVKGMSLVFQGSRARTRAWYAPGNPTAERYNRSRYDWQILLSRLSAYCFAYHIFLLFFSFFPSLFNLLFPF